MVLLAANEMPFDSDDFLICLIGHDEDDNKAFTDLVRLMVTVSIIEGKIPQIRLQRRDH